jgi:glycosyltransferase involved in cell wall biosynthesis
MRCADIALDSMTIPLVSIVIRSANRPELVQALASLAVQTYTNIEIILVDVAGHEEFDTPSHWSGSLPLHIASTGQPLNRGAAANLGLDRARGDYIAFLDDDDWLLPDHVELLVAALREQPANQVAYAGVICRSEISPGVWDTVRIYNDPYDPVRLLIENYLPMHAVLFDARLLAKGPRFDETLRVYEDWDFWIQLSLLTNFIHVDGITAVYRISATSGFGVREEDPEAYPGIKAMVNKWLGKLKFEQIVAVWLFPTKHPESPRATVEPRQLDDYVRLEQMMDHIIDLERALVERDAIISELWRSGEEAASVDKTGGVTLGMGEQVTSAVTSP